MAPINSQNSAEKDSLAQVLAIAGPTAVGKSDVSLLLAEHLNGEIVSVDSMQVYHGMDIGTGKPSTEERRRVSHHLIDVTDLQTPFDAAKFVSLAEAAIADILKRKRRPILCGGTGLYFKALFSGLGTAPPAHSQMRAELERLPLAVLLEELENKDPELFTSIDRNNPRRVIRAVEVIRQTGQPFSQQKSAWSDSAAATAPALYCLQREAADLKARIDTRVENMFRSGLVAETEGLLKLGLAQNQTAMQALGYRQLVEHLRGERSLENTIELVKIRTRQFAKRQMTWFRRQPNVVWICVQDQESSQSIAERIEQLVAVNPGPG